MKYETINRCLNLIVPFFITYVSVILGLTFVKTGMSNNIFLNMVYGTIVSLGFLYGVLSFIREIRENKIFDTLKYWIEKIIR